MDNILIFNNYLVIFFHDLPRKTCNQEFRENLIWANKYQFNEIINNRA